MVINIINQAIVRILRAEDVKARLKEECADPVGSTPEAFGAYIKTETVKWAKVIKVSGAKPE